VLLLLASDTFEHICITQFKNPLIILYHNEMIEILLLQLIKITNITSIINTKSTILQVLPLTDLTFALVKKHWLKMKE